MSGTPRAPIVALGEAHDARAFGGKAAGLARLVRAGLPVPAGVALDTHTVGEIAAGADGRALVAAAKSLGHLLAVRSSAVGEDGAAASFAGQHRTELAVPVADVCEAVVSVAASARTASAAAYRRRMGVTGCVATGAVVQAMLAPETAGVMFTRDPRPARAGRAERVVEASYGLGEAVVAGLVVPDGYRLAPGGVLVDVRIGDKDVRVVAAAGGGT
ncbi:MAG: PEP/pyruvate-binding domain-containing protein, partial [Pseudonocardia sp.]